MSSPAHLSLPPSFFNDTATTEIYTLSLHDALPISVRGRGAPSAWTRRSAPITTRKERPLSTNAGTTPKRPIRDRKSTRLNSSHVKISYAVFCLKKKKKKKTQKHISRTNNVPPPALQ